MKKYLSLISIFILTFFFASCANSQVKKMDISEIKTPCDCINAFDILFGEMLVLADEYNKMISKDIPIYKDENESVMDERYEKINHKILDLFNNEFPVLQNRCNEFAEFVEFQKQADYGNNTLSDCKNSANLFSKMEKIENMNLQNQPGASKKVKKIDISKIKTACDCIDAMDMLFGEWVLLIDESVKLRDKNKYNNENESEMQRAYAKIREKRNIIQHEMLVLSNPCAEFKELNELSPYYENPLPECKNSVNLISKMRKIEMDGQDW